MERRLPDDRVLLSQISSVVLDTQKASRQAAAARQSRVAQVVREGDIIEERLIAVLVDYPTVKERTTTLIERIFYEREYVRQTKLKKEVKLPSYNEELHRRTVYKNSNGGIPPSSQTTAEPVRSEANSEEKATPFGQKAALTQVSEKAKQPIKAGEVTQPSGTAHSEPPAQASNPFRDFVQPKQQNLPSQPPSDALPATSQQQANSLANGKSSGKSKKKFGLKWFFSAPFKTGKERKPDMEELSDMQSQDTNSDALSSKGVEDEPRQDDLAQHTSKAPLALTNPPHAPATAEPVSEATANERALVKAPGFNHEQAVRRALQEGAVDETQREVFTQIEEERNTIERVERYVDHQYFLHEYVVRVRCVGERLLGRSIEVLQRGQFLLDQDRLGKQIPLTHPVTVV